jgi:hypothetical protein
MLDVVIDFLLKEYRKNTGRDDFLQEYRTRTHTKSHFKIKTHQAAINWYQNPNYPKVTSELIYSRSLEYF